MARVQHRHGHPGQLLRKHHVVLVGYEDRPFVRIGGRALPRGDEAGPKLHARVPELERADKLGRSPHPAGAHHRHPQVAHLTDQLLHASGPGVPSRAPVHGDQSVHPRLESLQGPFTLRHVVVDDPSPGRHPIHHPRRLAQRRHEEAHAFLERDVDPLGHPLMIPPGRRLDERVHPDGPVGQSLHVAEALAEVVAVDVCQAHGLQDPDPPGLRGRGHELRIAARVHGAADQRHLDPGVLRQRGREGGHITPAPASARPPRSSVSAEASTAAPTVPAP